MKLELKFEETPHMHQNFRQIELLGIEKLPENLHARTAEEEPRRSRVEFGFSEESTANRELMARL